jgi:hypothetical protein
MKNVLHVFFNDHTSLQIEGVVKKTEDTFLKVHELQQGALPLFLEIEHQQLNTLLELTKVFPYVLLYFDLENGIELFKGAAFNLNNSDKPFTISTQYKKVLLLHYPISFKLEKVSHLVLLS